MTSSLSSSRAKIIRGEAAAAAMEKAIAATSLMNKNVNGIMIDPKIMDDAVNAGYNEGFDIGQEAGYEDGLAKAMRHVEEEVRAAGVARQKAAEALAANITNLTTRFDEGMTQALVDIEECLSASACLLAETLLGREISLSQNPGLDAISRALSLSPDQLPLTIYLHPDDIVALEGIELDQSRQISLAQDSTLSRGDARVDVGRSHIDATLRAAVARVRDVLLGES